MASFLPFDVLVSANIDLPKSVDDLIGPELLTRLDRLTILSRKLFAGKLPGERRSKRRGQSVEFDDYRPYTRGDDLRHLDWNVLARFDRLVLKLFREEEDQTLHLYLDASASMFAGGKAAVAGGGSAQPTKLVSAARLTMALAAVGLSQQNRVVISVLGVPQRPLASAARTGLSGAEGIRTLQPVRGRRNIRRAGEFLVEALADAAREMPRVDLGAQLRRLALARRGQGVAVLLSDLLMDDGDAGTGLETALNALVVPRGFDAACIRVLAPAEVDPSRDRDAGLTGDLRLTDIESSVGVEVTVSRGVLERYRERFEAHAQRVSRACVSRDINLMTVMSNEDPADVLLGVLRRRGVLG